MRLHHGRAAFAFVFVTATLDMLAPLRLLRSHPELLGLAVAAALYYLAHEANPSVFVLYTDFRYGWTERDVGLVLAVVGVSTTIVSAGVIRPAVQRLGERGALLTGYACGALGFAAYGLAPTGTWFAAAIPLGALMGLASPSLQALMSQRVDPSAQGQLQGALGSLRGMAMMLGPVLFTQVLAGAVDGPLRAAPGAPFLLAGLLLVGSLTVAAVATRRQNRHK